MCMCVYVLCVCVCVCVCVLLRMCSTHLVHQCVICCFKTLQTFTRNIATKSVLHQVFQTALDSFGGGRPSISVAGALESLVIIAALSGCSLNLNSLPAL